MTEKARRKLGLPPVNISATPTPRKGAAGAQAPRGSLAIALFDDHGPVVQHPPLPPLSVPGSAPGPGSATAPVPPNTPPPASQRAAAGEASNGYGTPAAAMTREIQTDISPGLAQEVQTVSPPSLAQEVQTVSPPSLAQAVQTDISPGLEREMQTDIPTGFEREIQTDSPPSLAQEVQTVSPPAIEREIQTDMPTGLAREIQTDSPPGLPGADSQVVGIRGDALPRQFAEAATSPLPLRAFADLEVREGPGLATGPSPSEHSLLYTPTSPTREEWVVAPSASPPPASLRAEMPSPGAADTWAVDTGAADTGRAIADARAVDTGRAKTGTIDTGAADTGAVDTGRADTGAADTGAVDTGAVDTGRVDTRAANTEAADTGRADTGAVDTGAADTEAADTGRVDTGAADTGDLRAALGFGLRRSSRTGSAAAGAAKGLSWKRPASSLGGDGDADDSSSERSGLPRFGAFFIYFAYGY